MLGLINIIFVNSINKRTTLSIKANILNKFITNIY